MARIVVEGAARLDAALRIAAAKTRAAALEALAEETNAVGEDAEAGAPRLTGDLRAGIHRDVTATEGYVTATERYSTFVEHGTYKDPAQPFMAPAAEKSRIRWPLRAASRIRSALGG